MSFCYAPPYLGLAARPWNTPVVPRLISYPSDEKKLGVDAYQDILKKTPLSQNQAWQAQLKGVGQRISSAAAKPDYQWEFNVLQGNEVNAFCLPGGRVAFWEGIMPVAQDDNGIAVVMGHEVAHALAHHGAERMTQSMGAAVIGEILSAGIGKVKTIQHTAKLLLKHTGWAQTLP